MDTYRVAAADQLRSYAAILGVGFQMLETVAALAQAIEENRGKELIFIDTPGWLRRHGSGRGLAHFLSTRGDIDTHLVLPASMKAADLARWWMRSKSCGRRLLFTKLDETSSTARFSTRRRALASRSHSLPRASEFRRIWRPPAPTPAANWSWPAQRQGAGGG